MDIVNRGPNHVSCVNGVYTILIWLDCVPHYSDLIKILNQDKKRYTLHYVDFFFLVPQRLRVTGPPSTTHSYHPSFLSQVVSFSSGDFTYLVLNRFPL